MKTFKIVHIKKKKKKIQCSPEREHLKADKARGKISSSW